jgi:hypothetical protein
MTSLFDITTNNPVNFHLLMQSISDGKLIWKTVPHLACAIDVLLQGEKERLAARFQTETRLFLVVEGTSFVPAPCTMASSFFVVGNFLET